jgi:hypothetical protein
MLKEVVFIIFYVFYRYLRNRKKYSLWKPKVNRKDNDLKILFRLL